MELPQVAFWLAGPLLLVAFAWLYWRYVWFFRNPERATPLEDGLVSPADGTVVYVRQVEPGQDVVSIKKGVAATVEDITREDFEGTKHVIGIFMSPFDVHYNRSPLTGIVRFIRHHPPVKRNVDMGHMHRRIMLKRPPFFADSLHIIVNERTVTKIDAVYKGLELPMYIVQIAGKTVRGIESFFKVGEQVQRGEIFGMIKIGSQVDLIVPGRDGLSVRVRPGDRVRAGETILLS